MTNQRTSQQEADRQLTSSLHGPKTSTVVLESKCTFGEAFFFFHRRASTPNPKQPRTEGRPPMESPTEKAQHLLQVRSMRLERRRPSGHCGWDIVGVIAKHVKSLAFLLRRLNNVEPWNLSSEHHHHSNRRTSNIARRGRNIKEENCIDRTAGTGYRSTKGKR